MTTWTLCLLALVFLMKGPAMWRTWLALFAASLAGKAFADPAAWVLIDLAAAFVVIIPPRKDFQKAIAWLFAAMMLFELGWLLSDRNNPSAVVEAGAVCGWLQLAALLTWGINERYGISRLLRRADRARVARHAVARK